MRCAAVLWDMDGVVVDTDHTVAAFWQALAGAEGFTISDEDLHHHVYGRHADHTLRVLFPAVPVERYPEIYERLREDNESLEYSDIPGAGKLLRQLRDSDVPLALVTGAQHYKVTAVLDQLDLTDVFDVHIRAEDVPAGKPDPACYRLAAERLGAEIGQCLVFEDALSGVASAVAAGATCVAIGPRWRAAELRTAGAVEVIPDFTTLEFSTPELTMRVGPGMTVHLTR